MADLKPPEIAALPVPATVPTPKMRKPPPKVRAAIEALVSGQARTITAAAKKVGLSREYLSRAFAQPHCAEALRTRAAREVALSSGRAAARLRELIDPTSGRVAFEATRFALGVAGIAPASSPQVSINLDLKAGYVIDLSERDRPMKIVAGDVKVIDAEPIDTKPLGDLAD